MSGLFAAIVGPSGAGKDSLIRAVTERLAGDRRVVKVKRFVTRTSDAHEDHHALDPATFESLARAGRFALTWRAHGLEYGVPSEVDAELREGRTAICNLSRAAVEAARQRWPEVWVALVTARPETLAARLAARGRETSASLGLRLERSTAAELDARPDAVVENDGDLALAADRLYELLQARRRRLE